MPFSHLFRNLQWVVDALVRGVNEERCGLAPFRCMRPDAVDDKVGVEARAVRALNIIEKRGLVFNFFS